MHIRAFQSSDTAQVVTLWKKELNDNSPHNDPRRVIERKLAVQDGLFFVGESGGRIIATTVAGYDGHRGWLYSVCVDSAEQRKGHGSQIIFHALAELKKRGCEKINLQIRTNNHAVEAFYKTLGFKTEARISMGRIV